MQHHKRKPSTIIFVCLAFVLGLALGKLLPSSNNLQPTTYNLQPTPAMPIIATSESTLTDIIASVHGKTGELFDESFLHALATLKQAEKEIATEAMRVAQHPEVKTMASDIFNTTDQLIKTIQTLQLKWDYTKGRM